MSTTKNLFTFTNHSIKLRFILKIKTMFYVYLIQSIKFPDQRYIGHTDNLKERLETHNSGGSLHTKTYRPWKLVCFCWFEDEFKATAFERYLKSGSGRAFANKRLW